MAPQETETLPERPHVKLFHQQYKDQAGGAKTYDKKTEEEGEGKAKVCKPTLRHSTVCRPEGREVPT